MNLSNCTNCNEKISFHDVKSVYNKNCSCKIEYERIYGTITAMAVKCDDLVILYDFGFYQFELFAFPNEIPFVYQLHYNDLICKLKDNSPNLTIDAMQKLCTRLAKSRLIL